MRDAVDRWLVVLACAAVWACAPSPAATTLDERTSPPPTVLVEPPPTTSGEREDPVLPPFAGEVDERMDSVVRLITYRRWIAASTRGGVVIWDPELGAAIEARPADGCGSLVVSHDAVWSGCGDRVLRWAAPGWTEHTSLAGESLDGARVALAGPNGELYLNVGERHFEYDDSVGRFFATQDVAFAHSRDAVFHDGALWRIHPVLGLEGPHGTMRPHSSRYPGGDPRRLRVDELGRLWVEDLEDGPLMWDGSQAFVRLGCRVDQPAGVAVDPVADRTWVLDGNDGLIAVGPVGPDLRVHVSRDLARDLLVDRGGDVWVGTVAGLVRVHVHGHGDRVSRERLRIANTELPGSIRW